MPPKINIRSKAASTSSTVPQSPKGDRVERTLRTALPDLKQDEITTLINLSYPSGEKILTVNKPELVVEIIGLLKKLSFVDVINYLKGVETDKQLVLDSPFLEREREQVQLAKDNLQKKIEAIAGEYTCPGCGGKETLSTQKQIRGADEAMSTLITCLSCGRGWRID